MSAWGHVEFFQPITKEQLTSEFYKQIASSAGKFYNCQFFKYNKTEKYPHTKLASLLLNNLLKIQQKKYSFDLKWPK